MYKLAKSIVLRLLGHHFVKHHETRIRKLLFPLYRGTQYTCPICEKGLKKFILISDVEQICPYCGSSNRQRQLYLLIQPELNGGKQVLEFSPLRCSYEKLRSLPEITYTSTDFVGAFKADKRYDITKIDEVADKYDLILCYHILEHIPNDVQAMRELFRILKPNGKCYIQTPFEPGDIYEDPSIVSPEDRLLHFDQSDHVRIYSVKGLQQRLESVGFTVQALRFEQPPHNKFGLASVQEVLVASK